LPRCSPSRPSRFARGACLFGLGCRGARRRALLASLGALACSVWAAAVVAVAPFSLRSGRLLVRFGLPRWSPSRPSRFARGACLFGLGCRGGRRRALLASLGALACSVWAAAVVA